LSQNLSKTGPVLGLSWVWPGSDLGLAWAWAWPWPGPGPDLEPAPGCFGSVTR